MKRILFVRRAYGFGGAEIRLLDWLERIDYTKYSVLVSNPIDIFSERMRERGVPASYVSLSDDEARALYGTYDARAGLELGRGSFWQLLRAWVRFLWRLRPDTVIFMEGYFFDFPLGCVLAAFLVSGGHVYMTEHSCLQQEFPPKTRSVHGGLIPGMGLWWYRKILPRIWPWHLRGRLSKRVLGASEGVCERIVRSYAYPKAKMGVINHGVDIERFRRSEPTRQRWRAAHAIPEEDTVLVCTARLSREKGLQKLLAVFQVLRSQRKRLWLVLAGDGPLREDIERLAGESSGYNVLLVGHLENVSEILQGSDIYILASDSEGFGIALIEAMATELVCVATRSPGPESIVQDGENGILAGPSVDGLFSAVEQALQLRPEQRTKMGNQARRTVLAKYRLEDAVQRALGLLDIECAAGRRAATTMSDQPEARTLLMPNLR